MENKGGFCGQPLAMVTELDFSGTDTDMRTLFAISMLKMHRADADDGKLLLLLRGDDARLASIAHTRFFKSFPELQPPSRNYAYVYVALTNWQPYQFHFAICTLHRSADDDPNVAVPPFPFSIDLCKRPVPFAPKFQRRAKPNHGRIAVLSSIDAT